MERLAHTIPIPPQLKKYRGAAHDLHRRYSRLLSPTFDADDLASVIVSAFCEAVASYDAGRRKKGNLMSWLYLVARQRIFADYCHMAGPVDSRPAQASDGRETAIRLKNARERKSLNEPISGTDVCLIDILVDPDDTPVPDRVEKILNPTGSDESLLDILNEYTFPSERELLYTVYGIPPYERKKETQIASERGCSRQWINYKIGLILKRLRKSPGLYSRLCEHGFHFPHGGGKTR